MDKKLLRCFSGTILKTLLNPIEIGENVINAVKGHCSDVLPKELVDIEERF